MAASTTRTVKAKFDGDAKGLIAAAAQGEAAVDRFGKDTERKFNKSGEKAAKGFGTSIKKWFGGAGGLKEIGDSGGTVFGSGFLGALKTPVLGPAIATVLGGAVAIALPAVGAIAASGMVAAFGAGLTGIGIKFAAESEQVKSKWRETTTSMGADMRLFSKPFESTLIHTADVADRTFDKFGPSLQRSFSKIAPAVDEFVDQTGHSLEALEPAVEPLADAFTAVLHSLGPAMQSAVRNVSTGLQDLSRSVKENPDGLADMVQGVGDLTNKALGAISALNDLNGRIEDLTGGTSAVDIVFGRANTTIGRLLTTVRNSINPFGSLSSIISGMTTPTEGLGSAINKQGQALVAYTRAQGGAAGATTATGAAVGQARSQFDRQKAATDAAAAAYQRQKAATDALISSLFRLQGIQLGLSGAQIGYQQALDDATASLKENGRTLDISTEKGRANRTSLNNLAQAANQQTQAMLESNQGTVAAARAAEGSRANFIRLATQMGVSRTRAREMAAQLIAIPNVTRTAKLNANKKDLETKLAQAKAELKTVPASKRTELLARIADLEAGIYRATHLLATVPTSKTVTIRYTSTGIPTNVIGSAGRRASGGDLQPGKQYVVGERRSEILEMAQNGGRARIISGETPTELPSRDDRPIVVENHIEIGGEVVRVVRSEISTDKRNTKRKVGAK